MIWAKFGKFFPRIPLALKFSQSKSPEEGTFDCGLCAQSIVIDVRAVGTGINCPHCDGKITVPGFAKSDEVGVRMAQCASDDNMEKKGYGNQPAVSLPSPRKRGESPKAPAMADESARLPSYRFTSAVPDPVDSAAIVSAISRGEAEVLKSRKVGTRHVVFGCLFCAKPIEIKLRQQGKKFQCTECSGTMIAPDHDAGVEAQPVSGKGGIAGDQNINLPRVKTRALQKAGSRGDPLERPPGKGAMLHEARSEAVAPVTGVVAEQSVRHRLNDEREAKFVPRDAVEAAKGRQGQWDAPGSMVRRSGMGLKRLRFLALIIMAVSMVLIVVMSLKRSNVIEREALLAVNSRDQGVAGMTAVQKAISLSSEFSLLSTVNQRLKYVRHPNVSLRRMKKHYAAVLNNTVFPTLNVRSYQETEINGIRFARMTSIVDPGKRQREFFFELSDDGGLLLDWESAVGYCDVDAMEYSSDPAKGPVQMRLLVKPADYYAFEYQDADAFDCYEITDLTSRIRIHGYVESGSANALALHSLHPGGSDGQKGFVYCTLVLRAGEGVASGGARQVRIERFVKDSWLLP